MARCRAEAAKKVRHEDEEEEKDCGEGLCDPSLLRTPRHIAHHPRNSFAPTVDAGLTSFQGDFVRVDAFQLDESVDPDAR